MGATERDPQARARWQEQIKQLDANTLVVIDECGSNIALTPLYARAPKGKRAKSSAPRNRGKNTTLIAALTWSGMGPSMIVEGSANAVAFEKYVEEILAPSLVTGQIVILDNLGAHKGKKVVELIEARGCHLLFLPGYSPDFSPIEEAFSKLKNALRRTGARTREDLQEAICQALLTITTQDAQAWFRHCGYLPAQRSA
jgi:transposase